MRQVPENSAAVHYGIVGHGRVARHFAHYFDSLKISFKTWSRQQSTSCAEVLSLAKVILVLISDSQIEKFISEQAAHSALADKKWVHFSGSLVTPLAFGAHPLMTFAEVLYAPEFYKTIPFITDEPAGRFHELFSELPNQAFAVPAQAKPLYHALCVLSGNFTTLLWQKAFRDFESKLDLPAAALRPYLDQVVANLKNHPDAALTGPLARHDHVTIEKNLAALEGDAFKAVYESFVAAHQSPLKGRIL